MTGPSTLLSVKDLAVSYRSSDGAEVNAVESVNLDVAKGEFVAIVGESGSGKTTTAHALIGLLPRSGQVVGGTASLSGDDLLSHSEKSWQQVRGRQVGLIPQDPLVALNPVKRIGDQIAEALTIHGIADKKIARVEAIEALERVGLSDPELRARQYPHELSGGMRQRVLIAVATIAKPSLVIADEPTSALDVTVQRHILDQIDELVRDSGTGVLLITHDLGVAAERADRIVVMSQGRVVETGAPDQILNHSRHTYTRQLIAAAPSLGSRRLVAPLTRAEPGTRPLLEVRDLAKEFSLSHGGKSKTFRAVDDVSFTIKRGETYAIVGESGSGKSTAARLALRLAEPTEGAVVFDGENITAWRGAALRNLRRRFQIIYQNPYASLDPRYTIGRTIAEPLRAFKIGSRADQVRRAGELLDRVGLQPGMLNRRPDELSGGQRQRVAIARALALEPDLVVCDEPVSALDVSVQSQILDLLVELQRELGMSYLFISHDLAVVRQIAHRVGVMRAGVLVEEGATEDIFANPQQDYTRELLAAIPQLRQQEVTAT